MIWSIKRTPFSQNVLDATFFNLLINFECHKNSFYDFGVRQTEIKIFPSVDGRIIKQKINNFLSLRYSSLSCLFWDASLCFSFRLLTMIRWFSGIWFASFSNTWLVEFFTFILLFQCSSQHETYPWLVSNLRWNLTFHFPNQNAECS